MVTSGAENEAASTVPGCSSAKRSWSIFTGQELVEVSTRAPLCVITHNGGASWPNGPKNSKLIASRSARESSMSA